MDVIYPRCCGLDVHKREVVACVVSTDPNGTPHKEVRAFATMTLTSWRWLTGWRPRR